MMKMLTRKHRCNCPKICGRLIGWLVTKGVLFGNMLLPKLHQCSCNVQDCIDELNVFHSLLVIYDFKRSVFLENPERLRSFNAHDHRTVPHFRNVPTSVCLHATSVFFSIVELSFISKPRVDSSRANSSRVNEPQRLDPARGSVRALSQHTRGGSSCDYLKPCDKSTYNVAIVVQKTQFSLTQ